MSRLLSQIKGTLAFFVSLKTPPALIGGLALSSHGVVRATRDVDFLVEKKKGSGSFPRVGSGPAAWSEFRGDNEPDPVSVNVFAALMEAVKSYSLGQISHVLYDAGGEYRRNM